MAGKFSVQIVMCQLGPCASQGPGQAPAAATNLKGSRRAKPAQARDTADFLDGTRSERLAGIGVACMPVPGCLADGATPVTPNRLPTPPRAGTATERPSPAGRTGCWPACAAVGPTGRWSWSPTRPMPPCTCRRWSITAVVRLRLVVQRSFHSVGTTPLRCRVGERGWR